MGTRSSHLGHFFLLLLRLVLNRGEVPLLFKWRGCSDGAGLRRKREKREGARGSPKHLEAKPESAPAYTRAKTQADLRLA